MNVTPLIDILLVLLIIFMVITPTAPRGLPAFAPQDNTNSSSAPLETAIVLELRADHSLRLNSHELSVTELPSEINSVYGKRANKVLFIEADQNLEYRDVAHLLDLVKGIDPSLQVGLTKLAS